MSIRQMLLGSFLLIILLAGGQGYASMRALTDVGGLVSRMYEGPLTGISFARSAQTNFADALRHMLAAVRLSQQFGSAADRAPIDKAFKAFQADLDVATERLDDDGIRGRVAAVTTLAVAWKAEGDKLLGGAVGSGAITEIPTTTVIEERGERIYEAIGEVVEEAAVYGYTFSTRAAEIVDGHITTGIAVVGVVIVVSLAFALLISGRLVGRVRIAMDAARRVADGDLDNTVTAKGRDEVGRLLAALGDMQQRLRDRRDADRLASEAKERETAAADRRRSDLESRIAEFEGEVAAVMRPVQEAIERMRSTSGRVVALSVDTDSKTGIVAASTRQASENVQSVASAAEQLATSIAEISQRVGDAGRSANEAVAEAQQTNVTVTELANAAIRIGAIVDMIQSIAAQTNLLALNATIEAARAGDAGKGFAVVASEVKSLATQTAKATEEITAQIAAMRTASEQASSAIGSIGGTILRINEQTTTIASAVEEQNAATSEIAREVQKAAIGTDEVSMTIGAVSGIVAESGRMAGSLAEISADVADRSQALMGSIDGFLKRIRAA